MLEYLKCRFNYVLIKKNDFYVLTLFQTRKFEIFRVFKNGLYLKLEILVDLFVCDFVYYKKRFKICYNFCSLYYVNNLFLSLSLKLLDSGISAGDIFKSSIGMEREVYDMFGIKFINNGDLRKILTDYTFFGFPLRKDFPLSGYTELYYDEKKKSTFESLIELMQEFRFYILSNYLEFGDLQ